MYERLLSTTDRIVPYAIFTDPELGRVGTTEREVRKAGKKIKVGRYEMSKNEKAKEQGDTAGFVKVVVAADTKRLLAAAVLAVGGAELVHLYVDFNERRRALHSYRRCRAYPSNHGQGSTKRSVGSFIEVRKPSLLSCNR